LPLDFGSLASKDGTDEKYQLAQWGWDHADSQCKSQGKRLCKFAEYCPDGELKPPVHGIQDGNDRWAAVGDDRGDFVQISTAALICKRHSVCCGGKPGWAQTGSTGGKSLCCGKADTAVRAKFRASLGEITYPKAEVIKDPAAVLARMEYWKDSTKMLTSNAFFKVFPRHEDKYLSIEMDTGGFNNIRLGLEAMVVYAAVTGRTLVFPPATSWCVLL
jgi:hypothetical protein